jgi:hypothetical protein
MLNDITDFSRQPIFVSGATVGAARHFRIVALGSISRVHDTLGGPQLTYAGRLSQ